MREEKVIFEELRKGGQIASREQTRTMIKKVHTPKNKKKIKSEIRATKKEREGPTSRKILNCPHDEKKSILWDSESDAKKKRPCQKEKIRSAQK